MERVACVNQDTCRLRDSRLGCREDVHHRYFPRRDYHKGIAKEFRELDENKVRICRNSHDQLHATEQPPEKPFHEEMRAAIALSKLVLAKEPDEYSEVGWREPVVPADATA